MALVAVLRFTAGNSGRGSPFHSSGALYKMTRNGWIRLGIALSILWLLGVGLLLAYEWFYLSHSGHLVDQRVSQLFSDILPPERTVKWPTAIAISLVPVAAMWVTGCLFFWVVAGFRRARP